MRRLRKGFIGNDERPKRRGPACGDPIGRLGVGAQQWGDERTVLVVAARNIPHYPVYIMQPY